MATATGSWRCFLQTNTGNANDGDRFISSNDVIGISVTGYSTATVSANTWYRLVIVVEKVTLHDI